ncbi:tRNA (adenosine(37)-N6)-threonylcarbamoyltransferase complex transferase subunit TsaD [Spirosoma koreense]
MTNYVLGIETSCDDTSAAVVDREGNVRSSIIISQNEIHNRFGGVYPEFASRAHIFNIIPTVEEALAKANVGLDDIEAIGVTRGPGLVGSLLVGLNTASALGVGWSKPVYGVNHLRGHLRSVELEKQPVDYPAIILLVSGGHTFLAYMQNRNDIRLLGTTRDDSVGETYDKVGRMLGLDFPAGPLVDRMAKTGHPTIKFPRPLIDEELDFSFSGLKSAVFRYIQSGEPIVAEDVAASFVKTIMDVLMTKCDRAIQHNPCASLVIVGGVAASPQLREEARKLCDQHGINLCLPPLKWSTDNAAMIALATWDYIENGIQLPPIPQMRLPISEY